MEAASSTPIGVLRWDDNSIACSSGVLILAIIADVLERVIGLLFLIEPANQVLPVGGWGWFSDHFVKHRQIVVK